MSRAVLGYTAGVKEPLPTALRGLFWDAAPDTVDVIAHRDFILDRVLEYGDIAAVRWAEQTYGTAGLRAYFRTRGGRRLSAKTRAFWSAMLGLDDNVCTPKSLPPTNNPLWPY